MKYLLSLLCVMSLAQAQNLTTLMPRDTFFALGLQDGQALLETFPELELEWQSLDIVDALFSVSGVDTSEADIAAIEEGINSLDFLQQEAWLSFSASRYSPLPALLLLAEIDDDTRATVVDMLASADASGDFKEGDYTFYQAAGDDEVVLFYALADDILLLTTNPEVMRGSLRQLARSNDPSFVDSDGYSLTLATMPQDAYFYSYLDYAQVASLANPYVQGFGVDRLVGRVVQGFETAGVSAGYATIGERDGEKVWQTYGVQALNANAGDGDLYTLLTPEATLSLDALQFMPTDALSYGQNAVDLQSWWRYVDSIAATLPWLDGSLDDTVELFFGVSIKNDFVGWMGQQVATIVLESPDVTTPGVAVDSFLGETVYIFEVKNKRAANNRLPKFLSTLAENISGFTDPMGGGSAIAVDETEIAGVDAKVYDMSDGITLVTAFVDDYVLLATSTKGLERSLKAAQGENLASVVNPTLPANATAYVYNDAAASLRSTSAQFTNQMKLMAGITGSQDLDFDAIEEASGRFESFFDILANKLGTSESFSYAKDGVLYNESYTILK